MNFTREPIIETILSPRDGYKLCIKSSKIQDAEEIFVDAVEVVSFGQAFFFRGQERPKPFLVPVSDYQIFEVKEPRVMLKTATLEKSIKIGSGKTLPKPMKEVAAESLEEEKEVAESKADKKRERRRSRRRKVLEEKKEELGDQGFDGSAEEVVSEVAIDAPLARAEEKPFKEPSAIFTNLLPPPRRLISEQIEEIKERAALLMEKALPAKEIELTIDEKEEEIPLFITEEKEEDDTFFS